MKIPDNLPGGINGAGLGGAGGTGGAERTRGGGVPSGGVRGSNGDSPDGDRVQLSNLSQALRVADEDTPERVSKVDQLKQDYQTGRYQPDPAEVSAKIVADAISGERPGGKAGGGPPGGIS